MDKCHRFTITPGYPWVITFFTSSFLLHFLFQLPWGGRANHRLHPGLRLAALGAVVVADKGPRGGDAADAWAFWRNKGPDYTLNKLKHQV